MPAVPKSSQPESEKRLPRVDPPIYRKSKKIKKKKDTCGNPLVMYTNGKYKRQTIRDVKRYSSLHCLQFRLLKWGFNRAVARYKKSEENCKTQFQSLLKHAGRRKNFEDTIHYLKRDLVKKQQEIDGAQTFIKSLKQQR